MILGAGPRPSPTWHSPLSEPASALVAVGAISAAKARAVLDDYSLAEALRADDGPHLHHRIAIARAHRTRQPKSKALKPRRVVPCDQTIDHANGSLHVRQVTLSEDGTSLGITWRPKSSGQAHSRRRHMGMFMFGHGPGGPPSPKLIDDRGVSTGVHFSGGGSDEQWDGHLTADQPLSVDSAWIELGNARIELTADAQQCEVAIEALAEEPAAHRFLWRLLAAPNHFHHKPGIEDSIEALIAAGALDTDDPVLTDMRLVRDAMPDHPGMHSAPPRAVRQVREPWRSLLSRIGREDGPEGALAIAAVTPEFEGFSVAVCSLESRPDGFAIEVETAPGMGRQGPFRTSLVATELTWWASDDRGNDYLGQLGSWSGGGEDYSTGEIGFWPALHPKARQLRIMPTAQRTRAVISLPLSWAGDSVAVSGSSP